MSYAKKTLIGSFFILSTSVSAQFFGYIARSILAKNLSTDQFGLFYSIFTFFMFLSVFTDFGFGAALTKFIAEFKAKNLFFHLKKYFIHVFFIMFSLSFFLSIILFFSAGFLAEFYFKAPEAFFIIRLLSIVFLFNFLNGLLTSLFSGFQRMFLAGLVNLLHKFFFLFFVFCFLFLDFSKNVKLPSFAYVFSVVLPFLFLFFPALKLLRFSSIKKEKVSSKQVLRSLFSFAFPSILTNLSGFVIGYIDVMILTALVSISEVGIYNSVLPTALILVAMGSALASVIFPLTSEINAKNEIPRLRNGIKKIYNYVLIGMIPLSLIVFLYSKEILILLFGTDYGIGSSSLKILVIGVIFLSIAQVNYSVLSGLGFPKSVMKINFFVAFLNAILNICLIPFFGIIGAALTTCLSYFLMFLISSGVISRKISFSLPFFDWIKILFCGSIFLLIVFLVKNLLNFFWFFNCLIGIFFGFLFYFILCLKLKLINLKEIFSIFKRF